MKKLLIPIVALAMILPAAVHAEQCRDSATGKYAKCGSAGAVPASQYIAKGKPVAKTKHAMAPAMATPAATPAKPGMMSMMKAKLMAKPTPAAAKAARCKTAKGKFVKCGTAGAVPA